MVILVDLDGPLADFEGAFLEQWKKKYPDLPFIEKENRNTFYIREQYPPEFLDRIQSIYFQPGFIENLSVQPGSLDFIKEAESLGHTLFICSSNLSKYDPNVLEKYRWVDKNLGKDLTKKLILTKDKTLVRGDFLIDDRPSISGVVTPSWKHVIFDSPYNRSRSDLPRIKTDWSNWKEVLILK